MFFPLNPEELSMGGTIILVAVFVASAAWIRKHLRDQQEVQCRFEDYILAYPRDQIII